MQDLPVEISPNPLVMSTVELRFDAAIPLAEFLPKVVNEFSETLPIFEATPYNEETKKLNPAFKYAAEYMIRNDKFRLLFGDSSVAFGNVDEYQLWGNYFPFLSESLRRFASFGQIRMVGRVGVRYASVFDGTKGLANDVLKSLPTLDIPDYKHNFQQFTTHIKIDKINLALQIGNSALATRDRDGKTLNGVYIDIDAYYAEHTNDIEEIIQIIDVLHKEQKTLLFKHLLKPEFISSLNPKY
jgi:uncharacterized protein (TIGR04255 family)